MACSAMPHGKIQEPKWLPIFDDPSMWVACTGESLSKWVHPRLKCLEDAIIRAQYREGEGSSFQNGRSQTFRNCSEKVKTNISILLAALKSSSSSRDLESGKRIHADAIESGHASNIYVASTLVDMYANCGCMGDARGVFDRMPRHDVVSWNALMLGYAENGEGEVALQLFVCMQSEGCEPSARTFVAALKTCTILAANEEGRQVDGKLVKLGSLEKGMAIHSQATKSSCDLDIYVASTLVDMYAKCGSMVDARGVFDRMPHHNVVSWTALMLGYAESGEGEIALQIFSCMRPEGCAPNALTFVAALKASTSLAAEEDAKQVDGKLVKMGSLEKGMAIHSQAAKKGCDSEMFVANTLVDMYAKCGSVVDARGVFDRMVHHDVVCWNALMLGYAENGEGEVALQLFASMQFGGCVPNGVTLLAALKACSTLAAKEEGTQVHGKPVKMVSLEKGMAIHSQAAKTGCDSDIYVANSLVDVYANCGSVEDARGVFDKMWCRDVVSWNALMRGYAENGEGEIALQLLACIRFKDCPPNRVTFLAALKACTSLAAKEVGKQVDGSLVKMRSLEKGTAIHSQAAKSGLDSDICVASALVDIYAKCGSMVDARRVFDAMPRHDVVSWTAIIEGYAESGEAELALQLFACMRREGCMPNLVTFLAALKACSSVAALEIGKTIHADIRRCGLESNGVVATCLVNLYGKCGSMVDAQQVFDSLATRDLVTWTALIAGYSRQGDSKHVFNLFERMQEDRVHADGITFLSILTACSHAGLVDKGKEYFQAMLSKYGISPRIDHYTCMVDLLGRANQLDDAVAMVKSMPFKPDWVIWITVLSACRKWTNVVVGRLAFESAMRLDNKHAAAYVLMANIYAAAGMWEESAKIHAMRRNAGAWKKPVGMLESDVLVKTEEQGEFLVNHSLLSFKNTMDSSRFPCISGYQ